MKASAVSKIFRGRRLLALAVLGLWAGGVLYLVRPLVNQYRFVTLHRVKALRIRAKFGCTYHITLIDSS